jgi:REP element-mobilizing transposase RayT
MPRPPRIHIPGAFYHVTLRGNHREAIFRTPEDRQQLDDIIGEAMPRYGVGVHAYCWMTNHLHLLARVDEAPLGRMIQAVASRYARQYQHAVPTTGHLFERRYHARLVATAPHLLQAVRYIHLNPVVAGIAQTAREYQWSSHCGYLGDRAPAWLTTRFTMALFDEDPQLARLAYARFVEASEREARAGMEPDYALADKTRRSSVRGNGMRALVGNVDLEELIASMCSVAGVATSALHSPCTDRNLSKLRADVAAEAVHRGIATLAEVAARMRRHPSSLTRLLQTRYRHR